MSRTGSRGRSVQTYVLTAWAVVILACGGAGTSEPAKTSGERPGRGEVGYLEVQGRKQVLVPTDGAALDEMLAFGRANNDAAIQQMVDQGRVLICAGGTRVSVVEPGIASATVRFMEGEYAGRDGVVPNEWLHARPGGGDTK
jgi:hypothetical protein